MIFLDSSFLIAYKIENDSHHAEAKKIMSEIVSGNHGRVFISDYIFDETITVVFARSRKLSEASDLGEKIEKSIKMLKIDEKNFNDAWEIFKNQKNTNLSFTDCSSISIMKNNDIKNIATFDKAFTKIKDINVIMN